MKRSFIILMAASALAAVSCTKEVNDQTAPEKEQVTMSFDATIGAPTKVELGEANGEGGYKVLWSKGDKIAVYASDPEATDGDIQEVEFTTDIQSASAQATFTGEIDAAGAYYAVYPYEAADYWDEYYDNLTVDLEGSQKANGIASGISIATANGNSLQFEHVTGYVKFTIPAEYTDIKEVLFSGNNGEYLAGEYRVYRDNGVTPNKFGSTKVSQLSLVPAEGNVFAPGTYYFTAFPANLTEGITITFVKSDDTTASKSTDDSKPASVKAGDILNLGTISNLEFESEEPPVANGTYVVLAKKDDVYYAMGSTHNDNSNRLDEIEFDYSANETHLSSLVWTFTNVSGATYNITNNEKYLVASSSNNANLANTGTPLTITANGDGTYCITVVVNDETRYLSRNDTSFGFAFYANTGQNEKLYLKAVSYVVKPELETPVITTVGNNANKTITVTWTDVENATSYEVTCADQSETVSAGVQTHMFTMAEYGTYDVTVTAKADGYVSAKSEVSSVVLKNPAENAVSLTFPDDNKLNNKAGSYTATWTARSGEYEWSIANFNNNSWNNDWTYIKCGRSGESSVASISTTNLTDKAIAKVVVTYGSVSKTDKLNSATLEVSSSADFSQIIETINITVESGEQTYNVSNPTSGRYYKLKYDMQKTGQNGNIVINQIKYIAE